MFFEFVLPLRLQASARGMIEWSNPWESLADARAPRVRALGAPEAPRAQFSVPHLGGPAGFSKSARRCVSSASHALPSTFRRIWIYCRFFHMDFWVVFHVNFVFLSRGFIDCFRRGFIEVRPCSRPFAQDGFIGNKST